MAGKFYPFNPKGSQFYYPPYEPKPPPPSTINLRALPVAPGDYIALRGTGSWMAKPGGASFQRMSGLFRSAAGHLLAPAPSGQEMPFDNWPAADGRLVAYAEDFNIPYDKATIVRVPKNAAEIVLNSGDWHFGDNVAGANCGVLVSLPNKNRAVPFNEDEETPAKSSMTDTDFEVDHTEHDQGSKPIVPYPSPTATAFSSSPFKASASADSKPQWRGWYQSGWNPTWSYFNAVRPTETHRGWDLFAPTGSKLIAPVGPCYVHFYPDGSVPGYGNVAAFFFSKPAGKKYVAIYAHCSAFIGSGDRRINMGDEVAYSGCTAVPSCGIELGSGGRTDHVHVGLYEGENPSDSHGKPIDPATFFKWSPTIPTSAS